MTEGMSLEEAIRILTLDVTMDFEGDSDDLEAALKLGIEAIKWRQLMERDYGSWCGPLLPGETVE